MSDVVPVAVIGAGHMGRYHVQKYADIPGAKLVAIIDRDIERAKALAEPLGVKFAETYTPELGDIAAASVAVPTVDHLRISRPLIERGIGVLVEKPLAPTVADAQEIADLAERHGAIVQVGHTERFNPRREGRRAAGRAGRSLSRRIASAPSPFGRRTWASCLT